MFRSALFILGLACVGGCASRAPAPPPFANEDRRVLRQMLEDQAAAWNRGDLPGFMVGYLESPDLIFTSGGRVRRGFQETLANYQRRYGESPQTMGRLSLEVLDLRSLGADGAVALGRWTLTDTPQAGTGLFTLVFERRPEGWRIVHDHTSSASPPDEG